MSKISSLESLAIARETTPTIPPAAEDMSRASDCLDSAAMALLNTADMCSKSGELEQDLINTLEDHGHALLRSAAVLRAKRLRRQHQG